MNHIDYAIDQLKKIPKKNGKFRIYAIALNKKGKIISEAYNSYEKTHPMQAKFAKSVGKPDKIFLHAEMHALIKAKAQVHKMIIVRIGADDNTQNAKPCSICEAAMKLHGVKLIEHTF